MKTIAALYIIFILTIPLISQEKIEEKVEVKWWVLPLFAVDSKGNPVADLKKEDVTLKVNNREVKNFYFYRRSFSVSEQKDQVKPEPKSPVMKRSKMVFFLFDTAFSSNQNFEKSKTIARDIIKNSETNTSFSIFTILPSTGLVYKGGPTINKKEILNILDKQVEWRSNSKDLRMIFWSLTGDFSASIPKKMSEIKKVPEKYKTTRRDIQIQYTEEEIEYMVQQRSTWLKKLNRNYLESFATLFLSLNSIKDNKFVYLFSEGISLYALQIQKAGQTEYYRLINQAATYLGKSGAVLFIVNPMGNTLSHISLPSGEEALRLLASESGGKYLEGETRSISKTLNNMHRAYYEISFEDMPEIKGNVHHINVTSNKTNTRIHTIRTVSRDKSYTEMKTIEKEILVLNLISQNSFFKNPLKRHRLIFNKIKQKKNEFYYRIQLPDDFTNKYLDIYKIWVNRSIQQATMEKEVAKSIEKFLTVQQKVKPDCQSFLVVVNSKTNTALVQGLKGETLSDEASSQILKLEELKEIKSFKKKLAKTTPRQLTVLQQIKVGTADYCKKLKQAAFHCICRENIIDVFEKIGSFEEQKVNQYDERTGVTIYGLRSGVKERRWVKTRYSNRYIFDYQLIRLGNDIKEQRVLLKGKNQQNAAKTFELKLKSFIAQRAILAPVGLLDSEYQPLYHYVIDGYDKIRGRSYIIIETVPKYSKKSNYAYGKLWIDQEDFSVRKIQVNPRSIGGFKKLWNFAKKIDSRLILKCDIEFNQKYKGIRFPTRITIKEIYIGGPIVRKLKRKSSWERSKTIYTYKKYQFFEVKTKTEIH